jgi:tetratricopeptide (TPR) repeat protein
MRLPESRFSTETRRRTSGAVIIVGIALIVAIIVATVVLVLRSRAPILPIADTEKTEDLIQLWNDREYTELVVEATDRLEEEPLDETALSLRGFARFYLAMQEVNQERTQTQLIGSVQDLKRALLLEEPRLEAQIHYVLGKAFFHRGRFFYDEAIEELVIARERGIEQLDLLEYLALASQELKRDGEAIDYYREAIEFGGEPIHKLSLADLLIERERYLEADALLEEVLSETSDVGIVQHALLSSGVSFRDQERWEEAVEVYEELLTINESSAQAHFGLGETYLGMGDSNLARYEWREAVRLDPNHIESLQRLQEY